MARATTNLAPGITFAIAAVIGYVTVYSVLFLLPFLSPFSLFCFVFEESWAYHFAFFRLLGQNRLWPYLDIKTF